jgi:hypothetical protein
MEDADTRCHRHAQARNADEEPGACDAERPCPVKREQKERERRHGDLPQGPEGEENDGEGRPTPSGSSLRPEVGEERPEHECGGQEGLPLRHPGNHLCAGWMKRKEKRRRARRPGRHREGPAKLPKKDRADTVQKDIREVKAPGTKTPDPIIEGIGGVMERRVVSQDGNGPPGAEVIPAETANRPSS